MILNLFLEVNPTSIYKNLIKIADFDLLKINIISVYL